MITKLVGRLKFISAIVATSLLLIQAQSVLADNFYAGVDLGKSKTKTTQSTPDNSLTHYYLTTANVFDITGKDNNTFGFHFGYNHYLSNSFFIGPEFRLIKNNQDTEKAQGRFDMNTYTVKYDDTRTLALRFGVVKNDFSYYLLGGLAQSNINIKIDEPSYNHVGESEKKHSGTILGIGAEKTILENILFGIQYAEIHVGNKSQTINDRYSSSGFEGPDVVSVNPVIRTLTIRASYLF
jgi:opacity protein-like surface antigen